MPPDLDESSDRLREAVPPCRFDDPPLCACPGILVSPCSSTPPRNVSFTSDEPERFHYNHLTQYAGGERAYWSWRDHGDYDRPIRNSQTQHRSPRSPRTFVDVTSSRFLDQYKRDSLESHAAAIQNAIDLSNGQGLMYEWDNQNQVAVPTDPYEGTPVSHPNDNRKRPLIWSRRHARSYNDPLGGSFGWDKSLFEVMSFQQGSPHPESIISYIWDLYLATKNPKLYAKMGCQGIHTAHTKRIAWFPRKLALILRRSVRRCKLPLLRGH